LAKRKFTVKWLVQFELVVEAENEQEAIENASSRVNEGESADCFDFCAVEEQ
jgi:hypothetical protein